MGANESFEDVRRLTEPELRTLLDHGRPEERIWAIWALALKSSEPDVETKDLAKRDEPAPGVRRNFAIVLAGHGHYDLLVALAKRDPASVVRASAMKLITRIAVAGKIPGDIVDERVRADGPEVKIAVLDSIVEGAPDWLVSIVEQLLEDGESAVRLEAWEALLRSGREAQAIAWLEEARELEARLALTRWSSNGRTSAVARALAQSSRRLRRLLIEAVQYPAYADLAPAIGEEPSLFRVFVSRGRHLVDQVPLVVIIRYTLSAPGDGWINAVAHRLGNVTAPDPDLADVLLELCEHCSIRTTQIERALGDLARRDPNATIEREELEDLRAVYERVLEFAAPLIVH